MLSVRMCAWMNGEGCLESIWFWVSSAGRLAQKSKGGSAARNQWREGRRHCTIAADSQATPMPTASNHAAPSTGE